LLAAFHANDQTRSLTQNFDHWAASTGAVGVKTEAVVDGNISSYVTSSSDPNKANRNERALMPDRESKLI
jgi:hypothetical protein